MRASCSFVVEHGLGRFVEDERHVLTECPAYDGIHADFALGLGS